MRLDVYLKRTRLIQRRTGSSELCRQGMVSVNGTCAKAGRKVLPGDRILFRLPGREVTAEVLIVPEKKNLTKEEARTCYKILVEKRFDLWGREIES